MTKEQAIREIEEAGAQPEITMYLRFKVPGSDRAQSFFPNHFVNMRRGEVMRHVQVVMAAARKPRVERRRPAGYTG